ncbi:MAG: DUF362 domain-containing protein [Dehalococcoidia bacterium]|nr:MAG: DUF362 domain-containing protein [Dehalococcoidia bacterium]
MSPQGRNSIDMAKVYFFTEAEKLLSALDLLGIEDFRGEKVPIKLHMGEPGNRYYISPSIVKLVVGRLKGIGAEPFLFDTIVAYPGPRSTREGYERVAYRHGFGEDETNCKVVIGEDGVKVVEGAHSFEVAKEIYEGTHLIVISHVKGHISAGFGGAIKNLGMGGVTKGTKQIIHRMSIPKLSAEKCDLCGSCAEVCPCQAITVDEEWRYDSAACESCGKCVSACPSGALSYEVMDFQKGLALAAKACIRGKRVLYINALVNITRSCDCESHPGPIICPDIGYLASNELAVIDRASLELISKVKQGVFEKVNQIDPSKQVSYAEEIGLLSSYQLRKL